MIKKGVIVATDGNSATIEEIKDSYCFECINSGINDNCLTCKKRSQNASDLHLSSNAVDAQVGDVVEYSKNTIKNVISTLMIIILPVILMIATYVVLNMLTSNDQLSGRIALAALAISMLCAAAYSYKLSKNRCDYKIISKINN